MNVFKRLKNATTNSECLRLLHKLRWSSGFRCPRCGNTRGYFIKKRSSFECSSCRLQTSATSGTVLHGTRNIKAWIHAIDSIIKCSNLPATKFASQQNLSYGAAWYILHKVRCHIFKTNLSSDMTGRMPCSLLKGALFKSSSESEFECEKLEIQEEDEVSQTYADRFVVFLLVVYHGVSRKYVQFYLSEFSCGQGSKRARTKKILDRLVRGSPISEEQIKSYRSPDIMHFCTGV